MGNSSAFLMPVQQSPANSALMSSENAPAEEDSFLGQSNKGDYVASSLFLSESGSNDPFATIGVTSSAGNVSTEQEPQLFVPPSLNSNPSNTMNVATSSPFMNQNLLSNVSQSSTPPPPTMFSTPQMNQNYMNKSSTNRTPLYSGSPYVAPNYGSANAQTPSPSSAFNSGSIPPPPSSGGFTSQPHPQSTPQQNVGLPTSLNNLASSIPPPPTAASMYATVIPHWCYKKVLSDGSVAWRPFSYVDSQKLEEALVSGHSGLVSTDGGRYDVSVADRIKNSIYWEEPPATVRRCTWFSKSNDEYRYAPFEEEIAEIIEDEYRKVLTNNSWPKQVDISSTESIVLHNPQLTVHLLKLEDQNGFGTLPEQQVKSRVMKRGIAEVELGKEIPEGEIGAPDHVVFFCHGIGPVCDLRSRTIVECVDDFRMIHLSLLKSHFKGALELKLAHRIEFLPVHWHRALHGDACGVDRDIRRLTLPSISRLRNFTNETLLDILFYSSPVYCQTIAETIGSEINSLYQLFLSRNPTFCGKFSLAGHSLGSLMLFDLLCHQGSAAEPPKPNVVQQSPASSVGRSSTPVLSTHEEVSANDEVLITLEELLLKLNLQNFKQKFEEEQMEMETLLLCSESDLKDIGLPMGPRKKLIGYLKHEQEEKERKRAKREAEERRLREEKLLKEQEELQNQNLQGSADNHVQRLESVTSPMSSAMNVHVDFQQYDCGTGQPMVKYPQLLFNAETFFALGSPIGMFLTVRGISELSENFSFPTCNKFFNIFHPFDPVAYRIEPLINPEITLKPMQVPHYKGRKRLHLELRESLGRMGTELKQGIINSVRRAIGGMQRFAQNHWQQNESSENVVDEEVKKVTEELMKESDKSHDSDELSSIASEIVQLDQAFGKLNQGRRIDYVLQERPLESFNDYLFAFQSHLCYWNSEDTVLLMMSELYKSIDVLSDSQIKKIQSQNQPAAASGSAPPSQQAFAPPPAVKISN